MLQNVMLDAIGTAPPLHHYFPPKASASIPFSALTVSVRFSSVKPA